MSRAADLYRQELMGYAKRAEHRGRLPEATHSAQARNPLCGDRATVDLIVDGQTIDQVRHEVRGCAICQASAAWMAEHIERGTIDDARLLADRVDLAVEATTDGETPEDASVYAALRDFKSRRRCATLPWEALRAATAPPPETDSC